MNNSPTLGLIWSKAKKAENFWFTIFYFFASFIVWISIRAKLTPNQLTQAAFFLNLAAVLFFMFSSLSPTSLLTALAVFTLAHIFDCADGHLAFVAGLRSERGYWLDSALDSFKMAFLTVCFARVVSSGAGGNDASPAWAQTTGLLACMGVFVNYVVALHASRYKQRIDAYESRSIDSTGVAMASHGIVRRILSHAREFGNVLVIFGLFAASYQVALCLLVCLGACHYALALHRVFRVACSVEEHAPPPSDFGRVKVVADNLTTERTVS
jgi:phosphatidylglycerophosphate synthase